MPKPTNFEAMTDTEINRWAAERDGFRRGGPNETDWVCEETGTGLPDNMLLDFAPDYATSADAALGLAERWGFTIHSMHEYKNIGWEAYVCKLDVHRNHKGGDATFPRALLNALCAAKEAEEQVNE